MDNYDRNDLEMIATDVYCAWDSLVFYLSKRSDSDSELYRSILDNLEQVAAEVYELYDRISTALESEKEEA